MAMLVPYVLFLAGGLLAYSLLHEPPEFSFNVISIVLVAILLSSLWSFYLVIVVEGQVLSDARYRLVSGAGPIAIGLALMSIILRFRIDVWRRSYSRWWQRSSCFPLPERIWLPLR